MTTKPQTDYSQLTRLGQIRRMRKIAERALSLYGIEPTSLTLLAHLFNTTFTVTDADGARLVLHIIRFGQSQSPEAKNLARAESELWWMDRLRADLGRSIPAVVRTPGGEGAVSVAVEGVPRPHICTLLRWVDGRFLRSRILPAHLEAVGRFTARLHIHSVSLEVPAWFDRPTVDPADGETEERAARLFTDHVSPEAGAVMHRVFRRVRRVQEELGDGPETFGLIHADIHQKNYLFHAGQVRLIDFGDCGWGHHFYDLAVTLDQLQRLPHRAKLRAALLAGYRQVRDLSPAHEALIDTFVILRETQDVTSVLEERDDPMYQRWVAQIGERVRVLERWLAAAGS